MLEIYFQEMRKHKKPLAFQSQNKVMIMTDWLSVLLWDFFHIFFKI